MKLVVIGGVAAGMSMAARARRLNEDAEIVVLERSDYVSFANCGLPYHVGNVIADRERLLLQTPETLRETLNLDVRTGHEVVSIDREARTLHVRVLSTGREYEESYDELGLAMGAAPVRPPLPGIDLPSVHVLRSIPDMDALKARVDADPTLRAVVVGAGFIGLETAENLRERGASVDLVEAADHVLPPLDREMTTPLEAELRLHGVRLHVGTAVAGFEASGSTTTVRLADGQTLDADLVVLSIGVKPDVALASAAGLEIGPRGGIVVDAHQRTSDPHIWAAGDIVETPHTVLPGSHVIPLAGPANREGRVAAENVSGRDTTYDSTQGTAIVKVFTLAAGSTGANTRQLRDAGIPFECVHVHPTGHAGYYPGTSTLHLKVLFDPTTGRLLGAQVVGVDGVDKRLDVLATVIRLGGTVHDLEKLELSYAPPFGSAKDPVNMAGFVASNVVSGDARIWHAEDADTALAGARIVDVREPEEVGAWSLPDAENVPLGTLREACEGWDRTQPVRLLCTVGFRSYLAQRALVQRGFADVSFLDGGTTTYRMVHPEPVSDAPAPTTSATPASEAPAATTTPLATPVKPTASFVDATAATGRLIHVDCTGLACPGPIMKLSAAMKDLAPGDEITTQVSDPGFASDGPAWARRNGHELVNIGSAGGLVTATFRKGDTPQAGTSAATSPIAAPTSPAAASALASASDKGKNSFVVFSGDLDKLIAAFIIANGALSMGNDVSMFFTFWGLNALRDPHAPKRDRKPMDKLMTAMMPSSADALTLSQMNMGGAGTAMIKNTMKQHNVASLPELIKSAMDGGARLIGCTMTMELLGIEESDLLPGIEFGGVATFLDEAGGSQTTLFI